MIKTYLLRKKKYVHSFYSAQRSEVPLDDGDQSSTLKAAAALIGQVQLMEHEVLVHIASKNSFPQVFSEE